MNREADDVKQRSDFLKDDFYDALFWLFDGAVAWEAGRKQSASAGRHQIPRGLFTSIVQARALYEFFFAVDHEDDDLRCNHFAPSWRPPKTDLYKKYMARGRPAQKLVFHLVRNRAFHLKGEGPERLNRQVIEFAKDLRKLTEEFAEEAEPIFRDDIRHALTRALEEAQKTARHYDIPCPV
jgi:hypothetical protein